MHASMNIHGVTKVEISTRVISNEAYGNYVVKTATIHCEGGDKFTLTLFGEYGLAEVPFNFIETEDAP